MVGDDFPNIAVLIIAAGQSKRLGQPKQLLKDGNGVTLLDRTVNSIRDSGLSKNIYVILGANHQKIQSDVENQQIVFVINNEWQSGMASSIVRGVSELEKDPKFQGVLILLCDQPLVTAEHFRNLAEKFRENPHSIICTIFSDRFGVPAIFPKSFFDYLKQLKGDVGARKIIESHKESLVAIRCENAAIDIDSAKDYENFLRIENSSSDRKL